MGALAVGLLWLGYQLGWYGYAVIQQPAEGGCVGFLDLMLPSHMSQVDNCIQAGWGKRKLPGTNTPNTSPYPLPGLA